MINPSEYETFKILEGVFAQYNDLILEQKEIELVVDGQKIMVKGKGSDIKVYDYILSAFGVIRLLRMVPISVHKTPLCFDMDHMVIDILDAKMPRVIVPEGCVR